MAIDKLVKTKESVRIDTSKVKHI